MHVSLTQRPAIPPSGLRGRNGPPPFARFMEPDPIGYAAGLNLYAYVLNDPVNWTDPSGLAGCNVGEVNDTIVVCGTRYTYVAGGGSHGSVAPSANTRINEDSRLADRIECRSASADGTSVNPAAWTPHGDTRGDNPRPSGRNGYNTDLPGGWETALRTYVSLNLLAGSPVDPLDRPSFLGRPDTIRLSASGIRLRIGIDYGPSGLPTGLSPRIDIPAGTFPTLPDRWETIHFRTDEEGRQCPTT